jgi:lipoprotein-releasing system permease protein
MSLRVLVGDTVNVINPEGDLGPQGPVPRSRPHRVVGVFFSGLLEYDETVGIVQMETARELLNMPGNNVTGIEIRLDDMRIAEEVARELETHLEEAGVESIEVRSWQELNRSLFDALALEKAAIAFGIGTIFIVSFLLILLVLWMFVTDKAREIAVLKSLGSTRSEIARIFVLQGAMMGIFGAVVGLSIGMGFVLYATEVGIPLPADVYYIDRVPIEVQAAEVGLVLGVAVITSIAGAVVPALQAAALDPVEGLRRE